MRYRVEGLPVAGMGAFMPGLILNGVSFGAGLAQAPTVGFPGTAPVAVEAPPTLMEPADPRALPSHVAPNMLLPDVYLAPTGAGIGPWDGRGAARTQHFASGGSNPLPEPAGDYGRAPVSALGAAGPAKVGGQKVLGWPRIIPRWLSLNSGGS